MDCVCWHIPTAWLAVQVYVGLPTTGAAPPPEAKADEAKDKAEGVLSDAKDLADKAKAKTGATLCPSSCCRHVERPSNCVPPLP